MRFRLVKWIAVLSLTFVLGGHWAVLQSIAWVTMAAGYAQTEPLKDALIKTFDGQHPCQICKAVEEGKKSEKQQNAPNPPVKMDLFLVRQSTVIHPPPVAPRDQPSSELPVSRTHQPPTPPPRAA